MVNSLFQRTLFKTLNSLPQKHKPYSGKEKTQPFFILGSGRNGSTLLAAILSNHSKIFIPHEQYALPVSIFKYSLYNYLLWPDLLKVILGEFVYNTSPDLWPVNFDNILRKLYQIEKSERTFQKIIDEIYTACAESNKKSFDVWGDKTPMNIKMLEYLYYTYPKSKYIFLLRDGRDVVSSLATGSKGFLHELVDPEKAAHFWTESIEKWEWLKNKISNSQLIEVRYESLVNDPEKDIRKITAFLGLSFEQGMMDFQKSHFLSLSKYQEHVNLQKPVSAVSIGVWKNRLTAEQIDLIMPVIEKKLREYGYMNA